MSDVCSTTFSHCILSTQIRVGTRVVISIIMSYKSFNICAVLDIFDVTCPGVWICPRGMVYLDIWLFGCNSCTSRTEPKFPLVFNETFSFHENFSGPANLSDVQESLEEKCVRITLVQVYKNKLIKLATYNSNVNEVLYPGRSRLSRNGETSLLMKNEPLFPGTISPKITLVTKTSVTEQINAASHDDHCLLHGDVQHRPNRMKMVHHTKSNSPCYRKREQRISPIEVEITDSDSDTEINQQYCLRAMKTNKAMGGPSRSKESCKHCEDLNEFKTSRNDKKSSNQKNDKTVESKQISLDNNGNKEAEIITKNLGKNIKATLKVGAHHYKCCKSKLNNSSSTNESTKLSDEESISEDKNVQKSDHEVHKDTGLEEPRKMNPKIKARLNLDVYHCVCDTSSSASSPSWRNICREVNRRDTIGDAIKYQVNLRNYYRRLYDGATYQLRRNLKLL